MIKSEKGELIEELKEVFSQSSFFYVADSSKLPVSEINRFRRICYEKGITVRVLKNTLARKAMESLPEDRNYQGVFESLHGPSTFIFTDVANLPAKLIKEFRKENERPLIKAAYIDSAVYIGDDQIDALAKIKSKEQLLGDLLGLLQSPAQKLVGALNSGGQKIAGVLKTLEDRASE